MSSILGVYFEYLAFGAFWSFVVGLDLVCLWSLRRSRIEAIARFLWMVWIVAVPIIGAISYFIVQPAPEDERVRASDAPFSRTGPQRQHWNENIQR
jgi:hypothetical protein